MSESEATEQILLCKWMKKKGICFIHVPNGGWRTRSEGILFKQMGVQRDFPDLLIFDPPPRVIGIGVALEMKKSTGGHLAAPQRAWLGKLAALGWVTSVQAGYRAARAWLEELGY